MTQQSPQQRRNSERKERERAGLVAAAAVSLLAHLALLPLLVWLIDFEPGPPHNSKVQLVQMSRSAWLQNRSLKKPARQKKQKQSAPKAKKKRRNRRQPDPAGASGILASLDRQHTP